LTPRRLPSSSLDASARWSAGQCRDGEAAAVRGVPSSDREWTGRVLSELAPAERDDVDRCSRADVDPVYHFAGLAGPVVVHRQDEIVYVGIPLVELPPHDPRGSAASLERMPAVTITLCLLKELARVVQAVREMGPMAVEAEITEYMCAACPLGTVSVVAADVATALAAAGAAGAPPPPPPDHTTQPAWRPQPGPASVPGKKGHGGKGKGVLQLHLNEYVRAVLYDSESTPDICEVFGWVHCKAEVEVAPEFTVGITSSSGVESMVTHASVQSLKPSGLASVVNLSHKLRFVPPSSRFELCGYKMCSSTIRLPIRGYFQMKAINGQSTRILIQLKLEEGLPNAFEYCEARLPFQGRVIESIDGSPNSGAVAVAPSGREVVWNLGHKWKSREVAAPVTVTFAPERGERGGAAPEVTDPFITGDTGCVHLRFKMPDFTMSDSRVDPNSLTYNSAAKIKLATTRHFASTDYKIWNSLGRSRRCLPPEQLAD